MGIVTGAVIGTLIGAGAITTLCVVVGLTPVGPVAGGMFAASQASGAVVAGSGWAVL